MITVDTIREDFLNSLSELEEHIFNRIKLIDHALDRNCRFMFTEDIVNCKRYHYMDYKDIRHRLYAKAEALSWVLSKLYQLDESLPN